MYAIFPGKEDSRVLPSGWPDLLDRENWIPSRRMDIEVSIEAVTSLSTFSSVSGGRRLRSALFKVDIMAIFNFFIITKINTGTMKWASVILFGRKIGCLILLCAKGITSEISWKNLINHTEWPHMGSISSSFLLVLSKFLSGDNIRTPGCFCFASHQRTLLTGFIVVRNYLAKRGLWLGRKLIASKPGLDVRMQGIIFLLWTEGQTAMPSGIFLPSWNPGRIAHFLTISNYLMVYILGSVNCFTRLS